MGTVNLFGDSKKAWVYANWVFRRLIADIKKRCPQDPNLIYKLDQAEALNGLHFTSLEQNFKMIILKAMRDTIEEVTNDQSGLLRNDLDVKGYEMYKGTLPILLKCIEDYEKENSV